MYYANYAEISHSQHDFVLTLVRVPAKSSSASIAEMMKTGILAVEPQVQVTFPPTLARPLIEALQRQVAAYEESIGTITESKGRSNVSKR